MTPDHAPALPELKPVPLPDDITDAARFPEIAAALEHARKLRLNGDRKNG